MKYKNILIVDDSSTSRMIIQRCLDIAGFTEVHFHFAENGLDALSILQTNSRIDLIMTDLNMPKMDGENFIKKLKQGASNQALPILVITSLGDAILEEELKKLGVLGIIKKPVSPEKILHLLHPDS